MPGSQRLREENLGFIESVWCSTSLLWEVLKWVIRQHAPLTYEAACLNISMKQLVDYQFNSFKYDFLNGWCFLFCSVSPNFSYRMLQCGFVWFCFLYWASAYTKYTTESEPVFLQWSQHINLDISKHFWRQDLSSKPVSSLNVCEIHSWVFMYLSYCTFVSIVCLQQKLSRRMIVSLIQISLTLIDSIWRDCMLVKALA